MSFQVSRGFDLSYISGERKNGALYGHEEAGDQYESFNKEKKAKAGYQVSGPKSVGKGLWVLGK